MLGGSLLGQKKYALAEPLLISGYEGLKAREATIAAAGKPRLPEAGQRLVKLYDAWGKPEKAAEWRNKLGLEVPGTSLERLRSMISKSRELRVREALRKRLAQLSD